MLTYTRLSDYLQQAFHLSPGEKIYKLALSAGCTCPNRDGTLDTRGCIFCSAGGSGEFAQSPLCSIEEQIEAGKALLRSKAPRARYIAYFQSFTNTYVSPKALSPGETAAEHLRPLFTEAIQHPEVAALSIATRPDCLDREMLDLLEDLNQIKPVWVELGLQTIHPRTAEYIRRGYPPEVFDEAVRNLKARNLSVIVHLILGLPGETIEDMAASAKYVSDLLINEKKLCSLHSLSSTDSLSAMPADGQKSALSEPVSSTDGQTIPSADGIKLQLLHVLKDTDLAADHDAGFFRTLSMEEYFLALEACLKEIDPSLILHRVTGDGAKKDLIAPLWSADKKRVLNAWTAYCKEH